MAQAPVPTRAHRPSSGKGDVSTVLARLTRAVTGITACWTVGAALVGLWNIGVPPRTLDLVRRSNSAAWLLSALFCWAAAVVLLVWLLGDERSDGWWWRAGRLAAGAALLFLSLDAVAGLQAHELPRLINLWVNRFYPLGPHSIDGDEIPPVTSPLTAVIAVALGAGVAGLRGRGLALGLGVCGLAALGVAAWLEWQRLLDYPKQQPAAQNLAAAIDIARLTGAALLAWAFTLHLRGRLRSV